ncbi:MAG TPA: hypothetical protein VKV03_18725 [Candidatus Binataceae bacterium]|nr:hypothetical protein [Candidatus Binataceae bacterium]
MIFKGSALVVGAIALALTLGCSACSTSHDASDPQYGQMFKQATHDRVTGNEFWGSNSQKDCTSTGAIEICTPKGSNMSSN